MVLTINGTSQLEEASVHASRENKLLLLDFTAKWCKPCQRVRPVLHSFASKHHNKIIVAEVDVDTPENVELRDHFNVRAMPTFVYIINNKAVKIESGSSGEEVVNMCSLLMDTIEALIK